MGCSSSSQAAAPGGGGGGGGTTSESDRQGFLSNVQLFKRLPKEELPGLAKAASDAQFQGGATIIKQGDEGDVFFVLMSGTADVQVNGKSVAKLKSGDYFGENALLRDEPRTASIIAKDQVKALKITREQFASLGLASKLEFPKRGAVAGGGINVEVKPPTNKTAEQEQLIAKALKENANLNTIAHLDDSKCKMLSDLMWMEPVKNGTELLKQGDLAADYFYIVQSGGFEISKADEKQSAEKAAAASIGTVGVGGSFGELALLYFAPRAATVKATADGQVWVCARQQFKEILLKAGEAETNEHLAHVKMCKVFDPLKDDEKKELAAAMHEMSFTKDETIFEQGERGTQFFLLISGEVQVIKDGKELNKLTANPTQPSYFGEKALENDEPRAATIKVISTEAKALWVDKESFEMLVGSLTDLTKRGKDGTAVVKKSIAPTAGDSKRFGNIAFKDLKKMGLLGCGGFGAVEMVEQQGVGETYALKALSKGYVVKSGMQASVMSEKNVQLMCDSPFIVKLYETYNSEQHLYFLLELALGGELYATYNKKNLWGSEKCAKFYVAGTLFAFEHLHSKKIIFRDLKPENLLLNDKGHVKLTDMGLAKVVVGKTFTTCGTPDYFAPELIASKGHNLAVDWWTLGILTFELMSGHPPFESATPMQIYSKVQKGINKITFPKKVKGNAEVLIKGLCHATPSERLPMKKGGTQNIKKAAWFAEFNWNEMETFQMDAPYKPTVKSKKDIANFSANKEDMPPQVPYKDPKTGWDKDFATSK